MSDRNIDSDALDRQSEPEEFAKIGMYSPLNLFSDEHHAKFRARNYCCQFNRDG